MPEFLNTDEAAAYLRLSERKLYELVAQGAVPCTKVTGRWLFPKAALDRWVAAGLGGPNLARGPAPPSRSSTRPRTRGRRAATRRSRGSAAPASRA